MLFGPTLITTSQVQFAQTPANAVNSVVQKELAAKSVVGVGVAVIKDGKVVLSQGYGIADLENRVPVTPNSVFQIGSITKQFTANIIVQLRDEGKLKLDESILTYLPKLPKSWKPCTVRNLLTHTSGIPNYTDQLSFGFRLGESGSAQKVVDSVSRLKLDFKPGDKYNYSNTGYVVLGMLIEKLDGGSYRDSLAKRILKPLGMSSTTTMDRMAIIPNRAKGYQENGKTLTHAIFLDDGWPGAAGNLMSTTNDLLKWVQAQGSTSLLRADSWKEMWTRMPLNYGQKSEYGFGYVLSPLNEVPMISHEGSLPGFATSICSFPTKNLSVIVMSNRQDAPVGKLTIDIARVYEPTLEPKIEPIPDSDPARTKADRARMDSLFAGKPDLTNLSEVLKKILTTEKNNFPETLKALGPVKELILTAEKSDDSGLRARRYIIIFEKGKGQYVTGIDKKGVVVLLGIRPLN